MDVTVGLHAIFHDGDFEIVTLNPSNLARKPAPEHIVYHVTLAVLVAGVGVCGEGGGGHVVKPSHLLKHTNPKCAEPAYNVLYCYVLCTVVLELMC